MPTADDQGEKTLEEKTLEKDAESILAAIKALLHSLPFSSR